MGRALMLGPPLALGVIDIVLGFGVLARKIGLLPGTILHSVLAVPFDYIDFRVGNQAGRLFGLIVSAFIVWALLRHKSRR